jgi:hypothetical protein
MLVGIMPLMCPLLYLLAAFSINHANNLPRKHKLGNSASPGLSSSPFSDPRAFRVVTKIVDSRVMSVIVANCG